MPVINLTHNGDIRHAADPGKSHSLMYSVALFPFSVCCFLSEFVVPFLSLLFPSQSVTSFSQFVVTFLNSSGPFLNLLLSSSFRFFFSVFCFISQFAVPFPQFPVSFANLFPFSVCCSFLWLAVPVLLFYCTLQFVLSLYFITDNI
jgi:hypothetical protein